MKHGFLLDAIFCMKRYVTATSMMCLQETILVRQCVYKASFTQNFLSFWHMFSFEGQDVFNVVELQQRCWTTLPLSWHVQYLWAWAIASNLRANRALNATQLPSGLDPTSWRRYCQDWGTSCDVYRDVETHGNGCCQDCATSCGVYRDVGTHGNGYCQDYGTTCDIYQDVGTHNKRLLSGHEGKCRVEKPKGSTKFTGKPELPLPVLARTEGGWDEVVCGARTGRSTDILPRVPSRLAHWC